MANILQKMYLQEKNDLKNDFYKTIDGKIYVTVRKYNRGNKPFVTIWVGERSVNPKFKWCFKDEEIRQRYIFNTVNNIIERQNKRIKQKQDVKQQLKEYKLQMKIGDVLHYSYGYNCTKHEFHQITDIRGKKITIRQIACNSRSGECWGYYYLTPQKNCFIGEPIQKIVQVKQYNTDSKPFEYVKIGYGHATVCDTNREYLETSD